MSGHGIIVSYTTRVMIRGRHNRFTASLGLCAACVWCASYVVPMRCGFVVTRATAIGMCGSDGALNLRFTVDETPVNRGMTSQAAPFALYREILPRFGEANLKDRMLPYIEMPQTVELRIGVRLPGLAPPPTKQHVYSAVVLNAPYWLFILPHFCLNLLRAWMNRRRNSATASRLCRSCGYDLRATPTRCPECGNAAQD